MMLLLLLAALMPGQPPPTDPLAPLSTPELAQVRSILRSKKLLTEKTRLAWVALAEPDKTTWLEGKKLPRRVETTLFVPGTGKASIVTLDLDTSTLVSSREADGVQPRLLTEEFQSAWEVASKDSRWIAALKKRGISDLESVTVNIWGAGAIEGANGKKRLARLVAYRATGEGHYLARPIEGLSALIDLVARNLITVDDTGAVPVPPPQGYSLAPASPALPGGAPRVRRENGEFVWGSWRFAIELHPREGLVLRRVRWGERSILYRASLSEMVVPYGDPTPGWRWRNAIDEGEYGMGQNTASLVRGADVPDGAQLLTFTLADELGQPKEIPGALALYERDGGLLIKHEDMARRARQLVLCHTATLGNYDYSFQWVFHEDGTLECETLLTGIMLAKGDAPHKLGEANSAHALGERLSAVNHQHFFCWRLDLDVDGTKNRLAECNTSPLPPGPENPEGNAIAMRETPLRTESEAKRRTDPAQSRFWKVLSEKNTGYALLPGDNALPMAAPTATIRKRAGFLDAHLWATPYTEGERWAAGEFPNQSTGGDGLLKWTKADRELQNRDQVLWYTQGITHLPRPEEWPVMNVHKISFKLVPIGFFPKNPTLTK
jgi:primary-amine oxidase